MLERFARKYALECAWKKGGSDPRGPEGVATALFTFFAAPRLRFRVYYLFALKCLRTGGCGEPYGEPLGKPPMHGFPVTLSSGRTKQSRGSRKVGNWTSCLLKEWFSISVTNCFSIDALDCHLLYMASYGSPAKHSLARLRNSKSGLFRLPYRFASVTTF